MLSKRLQYIADMINKDMIVADIGTDHAFLPVYLAEEGRAKKVYACDNKKGPLSMAQKHIQAANVEDRVHTILSDGLDKVPSDTEVIVIAGMGSELIISILDGHLDRFQDLKEIIVQGNTSVHKLRQYISDHAYTITKEAFVEEYKYYQIICFSLKHSDQPLSKEEIWLGPINLAKREETFEKYLEERYSYLYSLDKEHPLRDKRELNALKSALRRD